MSPDSKLIAPDGSDSSGLSDADLRSHLASQQLVIQDLVAQVANLSSRLPSLMVAPPSSMAGGSSGVICLFAISRHRLNLVVLMVHSQTLRSFRLIVILISTVLSLNIN
ncbi:hypothetical protein KY285_001027 [Solanum tuberosum]|nr:hypothetical protein KY285_001027 [Solanum tuberosum]